MRKLATVLIALALVIGGRAVAEATPQEQGTAAFYIDNDVDFIDLEGIAGVLVRNGAPLIMTHVPFGRATHLLKADAPGCGFLLSKEIPDREDFKWLARTLQADIVIATNDPASPRPQFGESVASYGAEALRSLLKERGLQPVIYHSPANAAKLFQTNRTRFIIGLEPGVMMTRNALGQDLFPVEVLRHVELWLGCNPATSATAAQAVQQAWISGMANGDIEQFYQASGLGRYLPKQK